MASKRKGRGKEVSSKSNVKFTTEEAWHHFETLKSTPLIYERGFKMEIREWSRTYCAHICALHWETFCHPRTEAILPWVYEFYANARFRVGDVVIVRGKRVDFSAAAINSLFDLDHNVKGSLMGVQSSISPADIAKAIFCVPEPESAQKSCKAVKSTRLSREAKVWLLFINASILLTRHMNNISLDRLTLIYCILNDIELNIGMIISEQLELRVKEATVRPLWFPTLTTELCRLAKVGTDPTDLVTSVGHHITAVAEVNVKVAVELGAMKKKLSEMKGQVSSNQFQEDTSGDPIKILIGRSRYKGEHGLAMENAEYIKTYLRCQHIYFESRFDDIRKNQEKIMRALKIPTEAPYYRLQSQFDEEGFLLHSNRTRADPTEVDLYQAEFSEEEEAEDDDDGEEEDDE